MAAAAQAIPRGHAMSDRAQAASLVIDERMVRPAVDRRIFLRDLPWSTYQSLRQTEANNHLRMVYSRRASPKIM